MPETTTPTTPPGYVALQLTVNNHPGVMSHVCGLFARRTFNVEGILVTPIGDGSTCSMWLIVAGNSSIEQMVKQVRKLRDVLDVKTLAIDGNAFESLTACMNSLQTTVV